MNITLRPLTWANFSNVVALTVTSEQADIVAANVYSIAETYLEPTWIPLEIYAGNDLVGFTHFGRDDETGRWWLMRYMIDARHQGKGYGTAALRMVIDLTVERHGCGEIFLSYASDNDVAGRLYGRIGFIPTGEVLEGKIVARLDFVNRD